MWLLLHVTILLPVLLNALPSHIAKSASLSASFESDAKPLFDFGGGGVGVNFGGYHASAGLGGLLTGSAADGGLHAEAGTPHGQSAGAGLGGAVGGSGTAGGGLYAGATAGGGVGAGAGLAGATGHSGSVGGSYAGSSSGGFETHITKVTHKAPPRVVHKEVEIIEEQPKPETTYIERTVIPNYVEKTVQVPSYVEKTIRVPTTIEKKIRVPAEPTIIEKTVAAPAPVAVRGGYTQEVEVEVPQTVTGYNAGGGGFGGGGFGGGYGGGFGGFGGGYGGGYGGYGGGGGYGGYGGGGGASGSYTATVSKTANRQFVNDVFNIPISTLGAVSKLVGGIAGGASGGISVSKSFGVGGGGAVY